MLVEIGHGGAGQGPAVTYAHIPEDVYPLDASAYHQLQGDELAGSLALHFQRRPDGVTHLPGLEPLLAISHPGGLLAGHGIADPHWIRSSDDELTRLLTAFHGVGSDVPVDLEDRYWTEHGANVYPPGAVPPPEAGIEALLTNSGRDIWSANLWSALGSATVLGLTGTATATSATSLTGGTESGAPNHAANDAAGQIIVAWASGAYGIVTANTSGTSPVYTVDRWYTPNAPGGAAAATPSATTGYTLLAGGPPAIFMGITANSATVNMTDTTLPGEITTAGGGLIRKICVTSHTAGTNTAVETAVFTANGSDSLPVTIAKMGIGPSMVSTYKNAFQTLLTATATLNVSGDQLTITDTITGS